MRERQGRRVKERKVPSPVPRSVLARQGREGKKGRCESIFTTEEWHRKICF